MCSEYQLTIREQPKHSRMCGIGEKADRRPIDPAPIVQLRVITHEHAAWYLDNPYYFMYAMLADIETDEELHLLPDGKTRYTTGSCVSCLYHLKDIDGSHQGFFIFPDLSIRVEGRYKLKLCLFETIGHGVYHCKSIYTAPFNVYTAKRFPGMEESTKLSRAFADQGLKVRVRKNPRLRRSAAKKGSDDTDDKPDDPVEGLKRPAKRIRSDDHSASVPLSMSAPS
ncbi:hypothetical protein K437DRAFT_250382, partial [Tilletiaria anomala UBC 951]